VVRPIDEEMPGQLLFFANYGHTKREIQEIIDMLGHLIDLFIQLCLQNNGVLPERKRTTYFDSLTNAELAAMQQAVQDAYSHKES